MSSSAERRFTRVPDGTARKLCGAGWVCATVVRPSVPFARRCCGFAAVGSAAWRYQSIGGTENAGLEKSGLENAGTPCAWVAKCNIINVRGHVRVNVIDGSPFDRGDVSTDDGASALVFATDDQLSFLRSAHVRRAGARQQMRAVPRCRLM